MFNKKLFILFLIMALAMLTACGANEDEAPETEPVTAEEAVAEPTDVPAEPTAVPTEPPVEPTEAPAEVEPNTEPTAVSVVEPAPDRQGILRFRDNDTTPSGSFQLLMEGVAAPPEGTQYVLWLIDDSFNALNLGAFEATDGNVQYTGDTDKDLLAAFNTAFISIEQVGVSDGEIGPIAFDGVVPPGSLVHVRHIVTAFPANPDGKAFLNGAQEQLNIAIEHAGLMLDELASGNIREAQRHAEHVNNILDGEAGANFGDLDGDTIAQNPGDGFGVRAYLEGAKEHAQLAVDAEDATAEVELHAGHVIISSDNALTRINEAMAQAVRIISSDSAAEAQPAADELASLIEAALNGVDANGDGNVAPIPEEGGILTAYVHAQNMASYEFFAADGAAVASAPAAEAAEDTTTVAEAEPAAEEAAPAAEAPAAAVPVSIDMANFAFGPSELTVSAGTAVTWVNKDSGPRHSATAADNSFDTGLFDSGNEATITFDTPGTYVYYCLLHGSPDGSGMAATITVTD